MLSHLDRFARGPDGAITNWICCYQDLKRSSDLHPSRRKVVRRDYFEAREALVAALMHLPSRSYVRGSEVYTLRYDAEISRWYPVILPLEKRRNGAA